MEGLGERVRTGVSTSRFTNCRKSNDTFFTLLEIGGITRNEVARRGLTFPVSVRFNCIAQYITMYMYLQIP